MYLNNNSDKCHQSLQLFVSTKEWPTKILVYQALDFINSEVKKQLYKKAKKTHLTTNSISNFGVHGNGQYLGLPKNKCV